MQRFVCLLLCCVVVRSEFYDSFSGKEINRTRYEELERMRLVPYCAVEVAPCDVHTARRMDGSCNNPRFPPRGTTLTPYRRMLPPVFGPGGDLRSSISGKPLPLVRPLRVDLMSDGRRPSDRFTQNVANYNVLVTGDTTSVHDTVNYVGLTQTCCQPGGQQDPRCIPVVVKEDDLHLRRSNVRCMNLTRAVTYQRLGCVPNDTQPERVNIATPMLDLSSVYGNAEAEARKGREFKWGRFRAEMLNGKEWPPTGGPVCVNNVPPRETRCHDSPMLGVNALMGVNLGFLWFYRSHNAIAAALRELNPCWDDDQLYYKAKEINIAYYNQILYYELMPLMMGWDFLAQNKVVFPTSGHVDDYDPSLEPRVSIEFVAGTRWFHTIQEGQLNLYKSDGRLYGSFQVVDLILRTGMLPLDGNVEGLTQGTFRQPAADIDDVVDPDIGERILGRLQFASDVVSSDLLKSRDVGLPPYNHYRRICGLAPAKTFQDLLGWMDRKQVEAMATHYEHPEDIDVLAAMLAEKPMPGAALGPTLSCIMAEQLRYWRRSDRFWFEHRENPGGFTEEQLLEIRKMSLAKLICQHGDGVSAVQPQAFLIPGHGNKITDCKTYELPNMSVFKDNKCYPHQMSHKDTDYLSQNIGYFGTTSLETTPNIPLNIFFQKNHDHSEIDIKKLLNFNQDENPTIFSNENRECSNCNPKLTNIGYNDPTKLNINSDNSYPKVDTLNDNPDYHRSEISRNLYPNSDPKVTINPNSETSDPDIYKISEISSDMVSIPRHSNIDLKSRREGLEYPNVYATRRNLNNPFEGYIN